MPQLPTKLPQQLGTYTLVRQVSKGGMAIVYEGRREAIAGVTARVAIKMMKPELASKELHKNLFIQEAKNASSLMHRNIVHTQDFEEVDGMLMLIMEYVEGLTAREMMRQANQNGLHIPPHVIAEIGRQICDGLHHAHCAADSRGRPMGLVHCDVKPGNIIINTQGAVKVLDFGVSKILAEENKEAVTRGTWGYMAPEQIKGDNLVPRTDLFALAIVLYEMAASKQMFRSAEKKDFAKMKSLMDSDEPIKRVMRLGPSYKHLQEVLIRALQRDPAARFSTAAEMGQELGKLVSDPVIAQQELVILLGKLQQAREKRRAGGFVSPIHERDQSNFSGVAFQPRHRDMESNQQKSLLALLAIPVVIVILLFGLKQSCGDAPEIQETKVDTLPPPVQEEPPAMEILEGNPGEGQFEEMPTEPEPEVKSTKRRTKPKETEPKPEIEEIRITPPKEEKKPDTTSDSQDANVGQVTISADKSAKIFIDGRLVGPAPVIRKKLSAGEHRIYIAPSAGTIKKFTIQVDPGVELIYQWSFDDERWLRKGKR